MPRDATQLVTLGMGARFAAGDGDGVVEMCGIVGYVGPREATPIIVEGLKRLEYRG